jgi:hypothetical protein
MIKDFQRLIDEMDDPMGRPEISLKKNIDVPGMIRWLLKKGIDHAGKTKNLSRGNIGEIMTVLTGYEITKNMIDKWTREKKSLRFPFELVPAFCKATGDLRLACLAPSLLGLRVLENEETLRKSLEKAEMVMMTAQNWKKAIEEQLKELKKMNEEKVIPMLMEKEA